MKQNEIKTITELSNAIENFRQCYQNSDVVLSGDRDGNVSYESVLSFLIENSYLVDMAVNIDKLKSKLTQLN